MTESRLQKKIRCVKKEKTIKTSLVWKNIFCELSGASDGTLSKSTEFAGKEFLKKTQHVHSNWHQAWFVNTSFFWCLPKKILLAKNRFLLLYFSSKKALKKFTFAYAPLAWLWDLFLDSAVTYVKFFKNWSWKSIFNFAKKNYAIQSAIYWMQINHSFIIVF